MSDTNHNVHLDRNRRTAHLDGERLVLQDKPWQVLELLIRRAPEVVSRCELIDMIWHGNALTGEKGLNQALWAIRTQIGDRARAPVFIRTIPRSGYQWLKPPLPQRGRKLQNISHALAAAFGFVTLTLISLPVSTGNTFPIPERCKLDDDIAVDAFRMNRNVVIDIRPGCRLILKPSGSKRFGEPLLSIDNQHIAFTVTEDASCKLVTIGLQSGEHKDFDVCPQDVS